jgi:hypothetical protein
VTHRYVEQRRRHDTAQRGIIDDEPIYRNFKLHA